MDLLDVKEEFKKLLETQFVELIEDISQCYSIWFVTLDREKTKSKLSEIESLAKSIAKKSDKFVSIEFNQVLGTMVLEFKDRKYIYANGNMTSILDKNRGHKNEAGNSQYN